MTSIRQALSKPIRSGRVNAALWQAYRSVAQPSNDVVVIQTTGAGSLGDQAMLDVAVAQAAQTSGGSAIVAVPWGEPVKLRYDVDYIGAPRLEAFHFLASYRARRAKAVCFVGADVVDGVYRKDTPQLRFLQMADSAGLDTACLGFSCSGDVASRSKERIARLDQTRFFVRDQPSLERFRDATGRRADLVADLAFLLEPELVARSAIAAADWVRARKEGGGVVLALNVGGPGLANYGEGALDWVVDAVAGWLKGDPKRSVLLVPHDFREGSVGDIAATNMAAERLAEFGERIHAMQPPFDAWDVKAVAGIVDFALTCRMHFMIACFGMATPGLALAYQSKFEGMAGHFGLDGLTIDQSEDLLARLEKLEADAPQLRQQIASRLPGVKELSKANFGWMA